MQAGQTPTIDNPFEYLATPDIPEMQIQLEQLVQQGVLSPEEAETVLLGRSEMNGITLDPALKQAQMEALSGLQDITSSGGLTAMDKARLNQIETEENSRARGQREAILQGAQARGMGGSGLELMSQLQNQQQAATRKSQRDLEVEALAQERALQALMQQGNLAGQMESAAFNQQAQIAGANDAISQFNDQNQQQQINQNVANRNQAAASNLAMKQDIANANAALRNQQQMHNKNLVQQDFDNKIKKAGGSTGVASQNANAQGQNSQNQANANNQLIGGILGIGASAMGAKKWG